MSENDQWCLKCSVIISHLLNAAVASMLLFQNLRCNHEREIAPSSFCIPTYIFAAMFTFNLTTIMILWGNYIILVAFNDSFILLYTRKRHVWIYIQLNGNRTFFPIGHVKEYPTMHYFGNPRHTQSMITYMILSEYFWKFRWNIALWECC